MEPVEILTVALCDLYPTDLDAFCLEFPAPLPMSNRTTEAMKHMAEVVLEHESLGDALARVKKYETE